MFYGNYKECLSKFPQYEDASVFDDAYVTY